MKTKVKALRPTYASIDLKAFGSNIEAARKLGGTDIIAIVKADGYGHGALKLAEYAFQKCGVTRFGVATVLEGINLRKSLGFDAKIIVLGYIDKKFYDEVTEYGLLLNVYDTNTAETYNSYLAENNLHADVSLKIDTGMHRLGFSKDSFNLEDFNTNYPHLNVIHVMSHLASSDEDEEYTAYQMAEFDNFLESQEFENIETSLYNSSGICRLENKYSLTRPGLMLYGYVYGAENVKLQSVMTIFSKIVEIKELKKGETVSYNRKYKAEKDMTIGVVPIGYADGYPRCFTNRSLMLVNGVKCPVVGTVCMDMTMVDLSGVDTSQGELEVVVLGGELNAEYWAELSGTISYEILCGISDRIPRVYID